MNQIDAALVVNLLGFGAGISLYVLLLVMVLGHRAARSGVDKLLLATSVLGITWNTIEFLAFVWRDFGGALFSPLVQAASFSALGFLPSVVVHSAARDNSSAKPLMIAAYALSVFASILHFESALVYAKAPSFIAFQVLSFGSLLLIAGLVILSIRRRIGNRLVWTTALLVFAFSAFHLSTATESKSWVMELVSHQSSLPLVIAILIQDYRFAFADLYLKRALSLLLLTLTAFAVYTLVASPLLGLHSDHHVTDPLAIGLNIFFWIGTALSYPAIHRLSNLIVDRLILKRIDYEQFRQQIAKRFEDAANEEEVLSLLKDDLARTLTAGSSNVRETGIGEHEDELSPVGYSIAVVRLLVPTEEFPRYELVLSDFVGGRRLMSDEVAMLETVALMAARRIDAVRVREERLEAALRERSFAQLTAEARLAALRSQINPHFLFNALTTIGHLVKIAPEKAFDTLMKLTRLLRAVLKSETQYSSLGDEMKLIGDYLDIEKARFEERLTVEVSVPEGFLAVRIPSLIVQPLVENAIKHAISVNPEGGHLEISASEEGGALVIEVSDSGSGRDRDGSAGGEGIGLSNVRERLANLYGPNAALIVEPSKEGTKASITLPIGEDVRVAGKSTK